MLCFMMFLSRQCKARTVKQLCYFRLFILTHPLCCRFFVKGRNHYLVLASPMNAEPPLWVLDLVNIWLTWLFLLSPSSNFFSSFMIESLQISSLQYICSFYSPPPPQLLPVTVSLSLLEWSWLQSCQQNIVFCEFLVLILCAFCLQKEE